MRDFRTALLINTLRAILETVGERTLIDELREFKETLGRELSRIEDQEPIGNRPCHTVGEALAI